VSALALMLIVVALGGGILAGLGWGQRRRARALSGGAPLRRIAFPFTGETLSEPALQAALRLARAEHATLMPIYLALVPRRLPVEVPLPEDCLVALPLLEAVEQRARNAEVPVDARIERGRTVRHALRQLMAHERFERMVVAAGVDGTGEGFMPEDVAWLLAHGSGELIVLRPADEHASSPSSGGAAKPLSA
jgi:hypothetical protein